MVGDKLSKYSGLADSTGRVVLLAILYKVISYLISVAALVGQFCPSVCAHPFRFQMRVGLCALCSFAQQFRVTTRFPVVNCCLAVSSM